MTDLVFLTNPALTYKQSFIEAVREFLIEDTPGDRHDRYRALDLSLLEQNFEQYIYSVEQARRGEGLPEGYVPESTFWLVEGTTFIGSVTVRHTLTQRLTRMGGHIGYDIRPSQRGKGYGKVILSKALEQAKKISINPVIITCDETNNASIKIIESQGGIFEERVFDEGKQVFKLRYRIVFP